MADRSKIRTPESMSGLGGALLEVPSAAEALRLFAIPRRIRMARTEALIAAQGEQFETHGGMEAWQWGSGEKRVLLMHGWNGRALNLSTFVNPLVEAGFQVIAFDAPAHGDSPGQYCYAPLFAYQARILAEEVGGFYGLIGHSFGTCAANFLLGDGFEVTRAVYLSSFSEIRPRFFEFAQAVGLDEEGQNQMWQLTEEQFGPGEIERHHGDVVAHKFKAKGLIIHDREDKEIPYQQSIEMAAHWPDCELILTEKLGHYRILRSAAIINRVVGFLKEGV